MTPDDFNYEPDQDRQDEIAKKIESKNENVCFNQQTLSVGEHTVDFVVKTYTWKSFKYRHAKTGKPCDALEGIADPEGIQSEETDEVEQEYRCADADVYGLPGFTDQPKHYRCYRTALPAQDCQGGSVDDALEDLLGEVELDLADPYPVGHPPCHLDQILLEELQKQNGEELASRGLRGAILAVDFGADGIKPVHVYETVPYAERHRGEINNAAVKADLYEISAPGHRYRRCERFASGAGQNPHHAIMMLLADYAEEVRRHRPVGVDAMEAGHELDLACALARTTWKHGNQAPTYVEAYLLDCAGALPEQLTPQEYERLGYRTAMGPVVCVVREKWFLPPQLFRPSVDWNDAMLLFDDLGSTMWGSAGISFDGDCFDPPPWRISYSGGFANITGGVAVGETGPLAISRAFLGSVGERTGELRWDVAGGDDHVYDPWGDFAREKVQSEAEIAEDWQEGGDAALKQIAELATDHDASDDMRRGDPNGDLT